MSRTSALQTADPGALAVELTARLLVDAQNAQSARERAEGARLARMMNDPNGKSFTLALVDRLFRSASARRAAEALRHLLRVFGTPAYLGGLDRAMLKVGAWASLVAPSAVVPAIRQKLRRDSARVILSGESEALAAYFARRRAAGTRVNVNQLGEAILGEHEAQHRLDALLSLIARPDVDYVSAKISAIFSQIEVLAWDRTLDLIKERLRPLYRAARDAGRFVSLDMEEYRDLELTLAAFRETLDEPEFRNFEAGIALQAYLPDSWPALQSLTGWARARVAGGGAPIKVRLVKGANLAMETVEAELEGWTRAPFATKPETDANFKRMLEFACQPENAAAVRIGVGSHNLFDLALALVLRERNSVAGRIELEMLEGMAAHQARAVQAQAGGLLVYAPIVNDADFPSALAYLIRRLDENTDEGNFLRDLFALAPGSDAWDRQRDAFVAAWENRERISSASRRHDTWPPPRRRGKFVNEPTTDWTDPAARDRVHAAIGSWTVPRLPRELPPVGVVVAAARKAQATWESAGPAARSEILHRAADVMAEQRFDTISCLVHHGKKAIREADAEVSEAIDFARYYSGAFDVAHWAGAGVPASALGVVVVTPPWNFPLAIPAGGALAALMAGNAVILKPSRETPEVAWHLVNQLWASGVPHDVLQFFPCSDSELGRALVTHPGVDAVVLTGSYETARMFLDWRPSLRLFAETSGKNAIVITALADRDLAIRDLVHSAFGHAGQKCSAASLAIVEAEVYDDPGFRRQLCDAASSLPVGPSIDPASVVTPLIKPPGDSLRRALTTLDAGESWLLEPRQLGADPCAWTPGIKLGVKPGSWFHQTECFGPVLGLIRVHDLDEAIEVQNGVEFGLAAGLHSLDEREIASWRERVDAGNLYINRHITGAIVQRQPFGGWKKSSFGPGAKAGGPNYVWSFCQFTDRTPCPIERARESYTDAWREYFSLGHDPSGLRAETNLFRYRPCRGVIVRFDRKDDDALALAHLAAEICHVPFEASIATDESDDELAARLPILAARAEFFRTIDTSADALLRAAHAAGLHWINAPFVSEGRLELRHWLREQIISETRHRYGNVMA